MSRETIQMALNKFEKLWEIGIDVEYKVELLPEIRALREELAKPANEFHPDWDTLKPYHDRIVELEAQVAKTEYPDLRKSAEMAIPLLVAYQDYTGDSRIANRCTEVIAEINKELAKLEQEPVKKALRLKPHECICGYSVGHPLVPKCICKPEYTAQPEHPLDKKADNARELGLDYEPDHGFDRTASHMAGGYVDTAQYLHMSDRQRLEAIVDVVCRYLPPDGISRKQALIEIIALVDPLPEQPEQEPVAWQVMVENEPMKEFSIKDVAHDWAVTEKLNGSKYLYWIRPLYAAPPKQWVGLTDEQIRLMAHNDAENDWNNLKFRAIWHSGYLAGFRSAEAKLREKNG